ncbi:substrate-binding domain-containing protein [Streptomyces griseoruber]|uniref:Phosphate ABC transporter substrate-binding protein n=1 Tax=Streptomyces griseoruber TaxID=1943 RepID=A0A124I201_9ACTN|nr:substrate-binding domain-containing protein [Streptomyces griseoruber]KUN79066.1 phosphate ABC transporter substrate-binding protein [Streptomyces griseoruber]
MLRRIRSSLRSAVAALVLAPALLLGAAATPAAAAGYTPISGSGSSWAFNAVDQWRRDVRQYGMQISYSPQGSSYGRQQFLAGTTDFAVSDIPFQTNPKDGSAPERPVAGSYAYMPIVAGGTAFMYHLTINGQRVTNLRLGQDTLTKIFTSAVRYWDDSAIRADNPGLRLPHRAIVPVVRSDGSGATAQLTLWMAKRQSALWKTYCAKVGRSNACGETSYYPTVTGMIAQSGDLGVAGYISQGYGEGSIGYVNYSYALNAHYPVAKLLNTAGYYTEPTAQNVAVSLLKAKINTNKSSADYLTQNLDAVYGDPDPRSYVLSSYAYMILPLKVQGTFTTTKGRTLGAYSYYFMCEGQQQAPELGYSPLPINLVKAGFDQIRKIPGVVPKNINIKGCNNPTFSADGTNRLATTAPMPSACDKKGATKQCATGSGGARQTTTTNNGSGGSTSAGSTGGSTGGGSATGGTGATGGTAGATGSKAAASVDPDTGQTVNPAASGGSGGTTVLASPVSVAADDGWSTSQTLMVLAGLTLLVVVLVPAVTAQALAGRNAKKEQK